MTKWAEIWSKRSNISKAYAPDCHYLDGSFTGENLGGLPSRWELVPI